MGEIRAVNQRFDFVREGNEHAQSSFRQVMPSYFTSHAVATTAVVTAPKCLACPYCTGTVPPTGMPPIEPVIVSEVIPVGTVMGNVVEEVPFAIWALGGTTPLELLERETVTF